MPDEPLTYRAAGVDPEEAGRAIRAFRPYVQSTYTPEVLSDIGSFGGLFWARFPGLEEPVLVSSIDGVGTKTKIATLMGSYQGLGWDIVGHCVNDILVQGARPLFFLDYFAASRVNADVVTAIVQGMAEACRHNDCALLGGEIAEMPGVYCENELDVVGCIVGVVERSRILPKPNVEPGDLIVGLGSDGLHTNGYSLARKALLEQGKWKLDDEIPDLGRTIGEELLRPHRSYYRAVFPLFEEDLIKGAAHITGGGFYENIPRILPTQVDAVIERRAWVPHRIFSLIQESGGISDEEMYRTFNMGIGMVLICSSEVAGGVAQRLNDAGESAYLIGEIRSGARSIMIV